MFFFGDPEDIACSYLTRVQAEPGIRVKSQSPEDMTPLELAAAMAWHRLALEDAIDEEAPQEVIDIIEEWFDELFCMQAATCHHFRHNYMIGNYRHVNPTSERVKKYDQLFRQYSSAD